MKKGVKLFWLFLCAMVIFSVPIQANAMTKANKKAHTAFKKQLKKAKKTFGMGSKSYKIKYAYVDVDGDKVDELIIYPGFGYCSQVIYDYQKGKSKEVCVASQGNFTRYYPKLKVIYIKNSGHMGVLHDTYYKWKSGKYVGVAEVWKDYGSRSYNEKPVSTTYFLNGKKASKAKYKAYVKRLIKTASGKKFSGIKWKLY